MKVNKENMIKAINTMIKMEDDNEFNAVRGQIKGEIKRCKG